MKLISKCRGAAYRAARARAWRHRVLPWRFGLAPLTIVLAGWLSAGFGPWTALALGGDHGALDNGASVDGPSLTLSDRLNVEGSAVYHVATYGNDNNDGLTWSTPFMTIQAAIDTAIDGDTILVTNGVYATSSSGATLVDASKGLTLKSAEGPQHTVISNTFGTGYTVTLVKLSAADAVLDGFTIANAGRRSLEILAPALVTNCVVTGQNTANLTVQGNVYVAGGIDAAIRDCRIINNTVNSSGAGSGHGAGIYIGGTYNADVMVLVENCVISNNYNGSGSGSRGSALYMLPYAGATIRNSLIAGNRSSASGAIWVQGSVTLENCTISGNYCTGSIGSAGIDRSGGSVKLVNTILAGNHNLLGERNYPSLDWAERSCVVPLPESGTVIACTDDVPFFIDAASGGYHLDACTMVNAGTNLIWTLASDAADLGGGSRIVGGTVDIGCFEYATDALRCSFQVSDEVALDTCDAIFTSTVLGANTSGLGYKWEISGAETATYEGSQYAVLPHTFGPGRFNMHLTVTNAAGESASFGRESALLVVPSTMYVSLNGSHVEPYLTLETASTNIPDAVNIAIDGVTILVDRGTNISHRQIQIFAGMTLQSIHGRDETFIRGPDAYDIVHVEHADAVVRGFTIERRPGYNTARRAVFNRYGLVEDCVIRNNTTPYGITGAGVYLQGGKLRNCEIYGNKGTASGGGAIYGAGIWMDSGLVERCFVTNNWAAAAANLTANMTLRGGAVHMEGGTIRNTVVAANRIDGGVGFYSAGGQVENSTICDNHIDNMNQQWGACVKIMGSAKVVNTIIVGNLTGGVVSNLAYSADAVFSTSYLDAAPAEQLAGKDNILGTSPLFVDAPASYALRSVSPCVGLAARLDWMVAGATDVIGNPRVRGARPDIGAFESQQGPSTLLLLR